MLESEIRELGGEKSYKSEQKRKKGKRSRSQRHQGAGRKEIIRELISKTSGIRELTAEKIRDPKANMPIYSPLNKYHECSYGLN